MKINVLEANTSKNLYPRSKISLSILEGTLITLLTEETLSIQNHLTKIAK